MHRVTHAAALPDYRLSVRCDDGSEGVVDLSDLVGKGVFASWRDESCFAQVIVDAEAGTIAWPGGIDLCPDSLYEEITGRSVLLPPTHGEAG